MDESFSSQQQQEVWRLFSSATNDNAPPRFPQKWTTKCKRPPYLCSRFLATTGAGQHSLRAAMAEPIETKTRNLQDEILYQVYSDYSLEEGSGNQVDRDDLEHFSIIDRDRELFDSQGMSTSTLYRQKSAWWYPRSYSAMKNTVITFPSFQNDIWRLDPRGDGSVKSKLSFSTLAIQTHRLLKRLVSFVKSAFGLILCPYEMARTLSSAVQVSVNNSIQLSSMPRFGIPPLVNGMSLLMLSKLDCTIQHLFSCQMQPCWLVAVVVEIFSPPYLF